MTNEQHIENLKKLKSFHNGSYGADIDRAIKALEQEPCEDAISRQETIEAFQMFRGYESNRTNVEWVDRIETVVKKLPSVTPQEPKTGHWVEKAEDYYKAINEYGGGVNENTDYFVDDIACLKCLSKFSTIDNETERFNYCPNCGAKMEVSDGTEI